MKSISRIIILLIFISCNNQKQEVKTIRHINETKKYLIEKNINDLSFSLVNGVLLYQDKPYSGIVNELYSDRNFKTKSEYLEGERSGYYKGWYSDGSKQFDRYYKKGLKVGIHIGWYKNNQKMFEFHFNDSGEYNGSVKEWYVNGILSSSFNYTNGIEEGSQQMWQPNGKIRANYVARNGERFGLIGLKKCYSVNTKNEEF